MKNVDELYKKYYNAYKNDYENDDELKEAKKKKIDCKQFELLDETDKKLKLDGETKNVMKEIENKEKGVDKKGFMKYFSDEPAAFVNKLLGQNTQDLRKSLDQIKQEEIKLNKDERNSTNNKNEHDKVNMILSVIDRIYQFFECNFFSGEQPDELKLLKWIKGSRQRFDAIKSRVENAKTKNIYRPERIVKILLLLASLTNYFKTESTVKLLIKKH